MKDIKDVSRRNWLRVSSLIFGAALIDIKTAGAIAPALATTPPLTSAEIEAIEAALGKKGTYKEAEATHNTPLPRNDLKVTLKGEPIPIPFGFGGWVAIKKTLDGKSAVLMSDAVLLQEEVNPLMTAAFENGLEISAIHNHFFYEEPRIFYMHIHGMGTPEELARKYSATIRGSKLSPVNQPQSTSNPSVSTGKENFDLSALDAIVKYTGVVIGPTYKYTVGRNDLVVSAMGAEMTPSIGLNSWASFAGRMERAHIAGDIAMLEHEVNSVMKSLRRNGIEVVALHNHMLDDNPRIIFLHYLGTGPAAQLAQGFRDALNQLGKEKSKVHGMHH